MPLAETPITNVSETLTTVHARAMRVMGRQRHFSLIASNTAQSDVDKLWA